MEKTLDKKMCILVLAFILIFGIGNAHAQIARTRSFDVLLIGTFISPDDKGNNKTFELSTKEDKWNYTVTKVVVMSGASVTGWRLLSEIFPRKIKLFGEERTLAPLQQPEVVGKNFKLRGRLYISSRTFHLNRVEEVLENESTEKEKKK